MVSQPRIQQAQDIKPFNGKRAKVKQLPTAHSSRVFWCGGFLQERTGTGSFTPGLFATWSMSQRCFLLSAGSALRGGKRIRQKNVQLGTPEKMNGLFSYIIW